MKLLISFLYKFKIKKKSNIRRSLIVKFNAYIISDKSFMCDQIPYIKQK